METYENGRILRFDDHVYVVDGKVLFTEEVLDPNDADVAEWLLGISSEMYVNRFYPRSHGDDSIGHLLGSPGKASAYIKDAEMFRLRYDRSVIEEAFRHARV